MTRRQPLGSPLEGEDGQLRDEHLSSPSLSHAGGEKVALTYGSVCSGIEAASVAWSLLGWRCAFVSEIEAFPVMSWIGRRIEAVESLSTQDQAA